MTTYLVTMVSTASFNEPAFRQYLMEKKGYLRMYGNNGTVTLMRGSKDRVDIVKNPIKRDFRVVLDGAKRSVDALVRHGEEKFGLQRFVQDAPQPTPVPNPKHPIKGLDY